jgi:hypothetical protein
MVFVTFTGTRSACQSAVKLCALVLDYDGTIAVNDRKARDLAAVPANASAVRGRYDLASDEEITCGKEFP